MSEDNRYDYRNCQSLFGYAARVHERSGGVCQLCGAGREAVNFDLWRQFTVEHLIGKSQGGYLKEIGQSVREQFPELDDDEVARLVRQIDETNTVTACSFCNSTTSRMKCDRSMGELIREGRDDPVRMLRTVREYLSGILGQKKKVVAWKLESVMNAYEHVVRKTLERKRMVR